MLMTVAVGIAGFAIGALLTGLIALAVYGVLYREAASMVDDYMHAAAARAGPVGHANWRPRIVSGGRVHD